MTQSPTGPALIDATALMFAGITPPAHGNRTTCPQCSPRRKKQREKCLIIRATDGATQVYCHHCKWEEELR